MHWFPNPRRVVALERVPRGRVEVRFRELHFSSDTGGVNLLIPLLTPMLNLWVDK